MEKIANETAENHDVSLMMTDESENLLEPSISVMSIHLTKEVE